MTIRLSPVLAFLLMLPLCAGLCSSEAPADAVGTSETATASTSQSSESGSRAFIEACLASTNWDRQMCECADRLSTDQHSDQTREFVIAGMRKDDASTERLRRELSFEEATQAGLFMVQAGRECATAARP